MFIEASFAVLVPGLREKMVAVVRSG